MQRYRPWLVMSSSSGETFRALFSALPRAAQTQCVAFITDRPCKAAAVAGELISSEQVKESNKALVEDIALDTLAQFREQGILVLLCGYFGILSPRFLAGAEVPVINTHPSLLPSFPGLDKSVHRKAIQSVAVSGFSVHLVTEELDGGPVIFQHPVFLNPRWSEEESRAEVRQAEQNWLPWIWEQLLRSEITGADATLSSRELRAKLNLTVASFTAQNKKELT